MLHCKNSILIIIQTNIRLFYSMLQILIVIYQRICILFSHSLQVAHSLNCTCLTAVQQTVLYLSDDCPTNCTSLRTVQLVGLYLSDGCTTGFKVPVWRLSNWLYCTCLRAVQLFVHCLSDGCPTDCTVPVWGLYNWSFLCKINNLALKNILRWMCY